MEPLRTPTEIQIQRTIWETIWKNFKEARRLLFHVPNESTFNNSQQASSGVIPGVPDLLFVWGGLTWYIELKDDRGVISDSQKIFHAQLKTQGVDVFVFYEAALCIDFITSIIHGYTKEDVAFMFSSSISPYSDASKYEFYLSEQQRKKKAARERKANK